MADNTVQVRVTAKDEASATLAKVAKSGEKMASDIKEGIGTIKSGMSALSGDFSRLGDVIGGIGGPAGAMGAAVVGALGGIITKTMEAAEGFRKLSEKTGAGVEFLSGFTQAADDVFVSSETVSASLTIFAKKLGGVDDAMDGSGISAGAFAKKLQEIGINSDNIEDALMTVADRFAGMANGADKTALAVQLFGKQGAELIPILNKGASGIRDMMTEAKALGLVLGDEAVEGTTRLKQGLDRINDRLEGIALRAGPGLIGWVADAVDAFDRFDLTTRTSFAFGETNDSNNLASKILGVARTYKTFTEVNGKLIPTLSVSNQALREFGEWALKAGDNLSYTTSKTYDAATAYQQMYSDLNRASSQTVSFGVAIHEAAQPTQEMRDAALGVNSAVGEMPIVYDNAQKATLIYKLATGQLAFETFKVETASRAVTKALMEGKLTTEEAAALYQGLYDKSIKTEDALRRAGAAGKEAGVLIDGMNKSLDKVKSKDISLTFQAFRTPNFNDAVDTYDHMQNKTVTVTVNSAGGLPNVPGTSVEQDTGGNVSTPYTPYNPQPSPGRTPGGYEPEAGAKSSRSFTVNNPGIVINSVNGAAIAQQIARQNANVARRARARASLMG